MAFVPLPLTVLFIASTSESCSSLVFLAAPIFSFFSKRMESPKFGEDKRSLKGNRMEDEDLEEKEEDEDESGEADRKRSSAATRSTKKGESCSGQAPLLLCQAENCSVDMTDAKPYHRRHRVCEFHSKASITMVAGIRQRFCQQCSRFHGLSEFDENKRSCRKRLAGHDDRRRRKPKPQLYSQNAGFGLFGRPEVNPMKLRSASDDLRDLPPRDLNSKELRSSYHLQGLGHCGVNSKELKSLANMEEKRQVASIGKYVGTDDQVRDIMNLMNINARDKRMVVVIHGEAGIGKTTLAKLIYSQLSWDFDGCSFLADITETTQELGGLQLLQSKLISDVLKRELEDVTFISRGIDFFRDTCCNMRVLIVLDDVENAFHVEELIGDGFDCFASGSRILVTTRNSAVLEESPQTRAYHVSRLNKDQARRLIWQHAPEPTSREILYSAHDTMAGLPLFIEVMGAVLNSTPEERWSQSPIKPVFRQQNFRPILGEVYQILDDKQKQIFLDIACFITGIDSRIAWYLWYDFSLLHYSKFGAEFLTPLAKIGENNQIWMHSMLRQFGREIVSGENLTDPGGHSRIFNPEIALDTIKRKKGTEKVEALCLNFQWHNSEKLTAEDFESMPNLRFLQLDHADIAGDFANVFPNLRWLRWRGCPRHLQVTNFHLGNLTILDLSWSKVTKDWEGWDQIEMKNLRVLDLTGCDDLLVTPKFSSCQNLAMLILERCSQLVEIDHSIGDLKCLASLNLKFCTELSMLPVEVDQLTALKELLLDKTSVQEISISIGSLKQLQTLSASNCFSLSQLSKTICGLTNIKLLSLDGTGITALPDSIGELVRLERLSLRDCYQIRKLPNSIGNMRGLAELDVSGTGIVKFPHSLKNLWNLKVLRMDSCFFREFPPDIVELIILEEIHACWCLSLEGGIPSEIGKLRRLRILRLRHSTISSIPAEIHQLSNLRILDLLHCDMIKELPELPSSITVLYVDDELKSSHPP